MRYTYSRWDDTQDIAAFDPDDLIDALSDDLMSDGDIGNALQRITRWGMQGEGRQRSPGLQHLLQRVRAQRQQELERYDLDAMMQGIKEQVQNIVRTERDGIERRLQEAADGDGQLREMLESIARRKQSFLDELSPDIGTAITALADYEFLDDEARERFDDLLDTLRRQVLQSHFESMRQSLSAMTEGDLQDVKTMLRDLNGLLDEARAGESPDFNRFMEQHGRYFPGARSLDELMEGLAEQASAMESLLQSMSPRMRQSLQSMMESVLRDEELRRELAQVAEAVQERRAVRPPGGPYPFSGDESLTLDEALDLMRRMDELDELEKSMKRAQDSGKMEHVDGDQVRRALGEESYRAVEQLKRLTQVLEDAGYVTRQGESLQLTARGIRKIGQKALHDIFRNLKYDAFGRHSLPMRGAGGDQAEDNKQYEFGDAFLLDMNKTLMNSVFREGAGSPLKLSVQDFEVFRTEYLTRSSTVLMLDMSRSMPLRGCFVAAKKVAFALNSLIRTQFPRDRLYIIGFSDYARELHPETLHQITWGDYVYGTNMQHGFMLARRLLGRYKAGNKQIILITDGEPTAHFEGERVHFSYPPTFRTFQETLREVKRCTREGIVINTFMLERSHYLADFVNQMTRINQGRAFFATPERLGDYILVDYVQRKAASAHPGGS